MKRLMEKKIFFFLLILITLSYLRSPDIFNQGRFWGEDGVVYFQNALTNSFLDNFFKIYTPTMGYYNLYPRIVALISSKFSLEIAPLINIYICYLTIFYIFLTILFNKSFLYKNKKEKFTYCLLVLLCPTLVPEIWLNSVNAQIYLSITALFILYSKNEPSFIFKFLNKIILFVGGFSSAYVLFLMPFYFIKYKIFKNNYNLVNYLILTGTLFCQLIFYIYSKSENQMIVREVTFDLYYMTVFFYNTFLKIFFTKEILIFLHSLIPDNKIILVGLIIILLIFIIYFFIAIYKELINNKVQLIITSSLALIFISLFFIVVMFSGEYFAGRYSSLPGFIIVLLIFNLAFNINKNNFFLKNFLIFLSFIIILSGIYNYRPNNNYRIQYLDCINNCIKWKDQVKEFKANKQQEEILIWPYNFEDNLEKFEYQNILKIKR